MTSLGRGVYVFGGIYRNRQLDTIELLNAASESVWRMITTPGFTARSNASVNPINHQEILISGGIQFGSSSAEVLTFDVISLKVTKIANLCFQFASFSQDLDE